MVLLVVAVTMCMCSPCTALEATTTITTTTTTTPTAAGDGTTAATTVPTAAPTEYSDDLPGGVDFDDAFGKYGWPVWVILMLMSFWGLAVVVEDFFVPALNVLCEVLNMPDDVAGATFMAAGASSPEMFAAFVSLFITRTSLGIGTIIGSEIFNHLCICAGSILYSKTGELELDARVLTRDMSFYALAIVALVYCEWDRRECPSEPDGCSLDWDDAVGTDRRIYLHWHQPLALIGCYGLYVLVCANYGAITALLCPRDGQKGGVNKRGGAGGLLDPGSELDHPDDLGLGLGSCGNVGARLTWSPAGLTHCDHPTMTTPL